MSKSYFLKKCCTYDIHSCSLQRPNKRSKFVSVVHKWCFYAGGAYYTVVAFLRYAVTLLVIDISVILILGDAFSWYSRLCFCVMLILGHASAWCFLSLSLSFSIYPLTAYLWTFSSLFYHKGKIVKSMGLNGKMERSVDLS